MKQLLAIDIFSGSGAVTQGLKSSGFKVLASVDFDPVACQTYRKNHPEVLLLEQNINSVRVAPLKRRLRVRRRIDLLTICAPCQPFSSQNRKRNDGDERTRLLLQALKFATVFRPKVILFENVPGVVKSPIFNILNKRLTALRYHVSEPQIHDAAAFGVPQRRQRVLIVASTSKKILAGVDFTKIQSSATTVRDAFQDLRELTSGEADATDSLHRARKHSDIALERLRHIPADGGSRRSLPKRLRLACHKCDQDFPDVYGRMRWDDVAPTLTTGCTDITRGRFAHPEQNRAITLREAARLQTFPDDYKFSGNASEMSGQIGNAVPVLMIAKLTAVLKEKILQ